MVMGLWAVLTLTLITELCCEGFYFPIRKVRKFTEDRGVMAVQKHRRVAVGGAAPGTSGCGLFMCVASGLRYHGGAWIVHVPVSDTRQSECVMWVCDCAHHVFVTGWVNSTRPVSVKTGLLDGCNRIGHDSAGTFIY